MGAISVVSVFIVLHTIISVAWANYDDGYASYGYDDYSITNITSPAVTNWGVWGIYDKCPYGKLVQAFQLKVDFYAGDAIPFDDTGLQAIKFFCGDPNDPKTVIITSTVGVGVNDADGDGSSDGTWKSVFNCSPGYLAGFQLRVEAALHGDNDNIATANFRGFCSAGYDRNEKLLEGDGINEVGTWGDVMRCPCNHAFCALQTQVEPYQGAGGYDHDDTSLNNILVGCCTCTKSKKYNNYQSPNYNY